MPVFFSRRKDAGREPLVIDRVDVALGFQTETGESTMGREVVVLSGIELDGRLVCVDIQHSAADLVSGCGDLRNLSFLLVEEESIVESTFIT